MKIMSSSSCVGNLLPCRSHLNIWNSLKAKLETEVTSWVAIGTTE